MKKNKVFELNVCEESQKKGYRTIQYSVKSHRCLTPCPYSMMATCHECGIERPVRVSVGSWLERDCPFFIRDKGHAHGVECNFMTTEFKVYNSR